MSQAQDTDTPSVTSPAAAFANLRSHVVQRPQLVIVAPATPVRERVHHRNHFSFSRNVRHRRIPSRSSGQVGLTPTCYRLVDVLALPAETGAAGRDKDFKHDRHPNRRMERTRIRGRSRGLRQQLRRARRGRRRHQPSTSTASPSSTSGAAGTTTDREREWDRNTLVNVFSTTKGLAAFCAHRLSRGGPPRLRRAGLRVLARVRPGRQGRHARPLADVAPRRHGRRPPSAGHGRPLQLGHHVRSPRRAGALVDPRRAARLSRPHLRLARGRGRPPDRRTLDRPLLVG